jgi:hypothetical protein
LHILIYFYAIFVYNIPTINGGYTLMAKTVFGKFLNAINNPNFEGLDEDGSFKLPIATDIYDTRDYAIPNAKTVLEAIEELGGGVGGSTIPVHFVGEVQDFLLTQPRAGFVQAAGQVLNNADVDYPEAWAEATKADPSLLICTAAERTTMIAARDKASPYKVGGVPYWTVDIANKTLTVPDLRMDFARAGETEAGDWNGDAIRNITGTLGTGKLLASGGGDTGAFATTPIAGLPKGVDYADGVKLTFAASRSVPTADDNRPRSYNVLRCVCVNPSLASRLEPTSTSNGLVYAVDESKDFSDPLNQRPNVFTTPAQASSAGMPSDRWYNLLPNSNTIAPADGYVVGTSGGSDDSTYVYVAVTDESGTALQADYSHGGGSKGGTVSVAAGQTMKTASDGGATVRFRFVYAQGAYVDGMPQDNPKYKVYPVK